MRIRIDHIERLPDGEGFVFRSLSYRVSERGHLSEAAVGAVLKSRLDAYLFELDMGDQSYLL